MNSMFDNCKATSIDLSSFNISNVENMSDIFKNCNAKIIGKLKFDIDDGKNKILDKMYTAIINREFKL